MDVCIYLRSRQRHRLKKQQQLLKLWQLMRLQAASCDMHMQIYLYIYAS